MKIILFVFILWFPIRSTAIAASCEANGTTLYFGNGMFSNHRDADDSLSALRGLNLSQLESSPDRMRYKIALNNNGPLPALILTTLKQKLNNNFSTFWRVHFGIDKTPDWYIEAMKELFKGSRAFGELNLEKMLPQYLDDLYHSRRILLVSHSQGNFYAIDSFRRILGRAFRSEGESKNLYDLGLGNVAVATPAFPDFEYPRVTFTDDLVMSGVRAVFGAPDPTLPAIGIGLPPEGDLSGHTFLNAYMYKKESRSLIQSHLADIAKKLKYPNPGVAPIKVDLRTKSSKAGFELRVLDPQNQTWRPYTTTLNGEQHDHFETSCSLVSEGDYLITIDTTFVMAADCPCEISLDIEAAEQKKHFDLRASANGALPNTSERSFIVHVTKDQNGRYNFEIRAGQ